MLTNTSQPRIIGAQAEPAARLPAGGLTRTVRQAPGRAARSRLPPVVILGGEANALSVARDLAELGVRSYLLADPGAWAGYSRHVRRLTVPPLGTPEESWAAYLLGPQSEFLRGAVVLACSDAGLQVLAKNRPALLERYRLDISDPIAQLGMLDKLSTYRHARSAGVPTPGFWPTPTRDEVVALGPSLVFPVMVKPRLSHVFEARFGRKHVIVSTMPDLLAAYDAAADAGVDVLLMEYIPGPDDRLCSYFTYLDDAGEPLFAFTKRVVRRYPSGMGPATYHVTDRVPEIADLGNRLFRQAGLRGLANVEFKRDDRDGKYKLIECNARFTASNCLVSAAGLNLAAFVYSRVVGLPLPPTENFRSGLRLWDPVRDFWAYRERRAAGELTLGAWARSLLHAQTFAYFRWADPLPAIARITKPLRRLVVR